jgi:hypothetical protein
MRTATSSTTFDRKLFTIRPNGVMMMYNNVWHTTFDNINRFYFTSNSTTFISSGGAAADNNLVVMSSSTTGNVHNLVIKNNGSVGIGTTNPNNILQVGDGGRLRISNGSTDSSSIGTRNNDNFENTRIYLFGNQHATNAGIIEYISTSTGVHKFITEGINEKMRINTNGNVGIGITNAYSLLHIKGTNPALTIMAQGNIGTTAQLNLSTYDHTTNLPNCSLIATDTGSYGATFQIKQKTVGLDANSQFTSLFIDNTGQVGIGALSPVHKLDVRGTIHCQSLVIADTVNIGTTTNNYQLLIFPPTSTSPATIQTILQGIGFNQVLALQYTAGQVAIGSTTSISKLTIKCTYDNENEGICINAADAINLYNMKIFSFVQASSQVGYKFKVNNIASSVEALKFYYDGGVNISSYLNIKDKSIYNNLFNSSGFNHSTITNFNNITDYGYRFINSPATNGPGTTSNPVNQFYTWLIGIGSDYGFNEFGAQFALPRSVANPILSIRYRENSSSWSSWTGITAEALTSGDKTITGNLTVNGEINFKNDVWHKSADGGYRLYFGTNSNTAIVGGGTTANFNTFVVYASSTFNYDTLLAIQNNGTTTIKGPLIVNGTSTIRHNSNIFSSSTGGLYVYNPTNSAGNCSVLGVAIGGTSAGKVGVSLGIGTGTSGWSMYTTGTDANNTLTFTPFSDGSGAARLTIRGNDGLTSISGRSLSIGDSAGASALTLTDIANAGWKLTTGTNNLTFQNDTSGTFVSRMYLSQAGNLLVSGDISAFASMSDRRLKHNITPLSFNCIDLINKIETVEFDWNDMEEIMETKRNTHDHGFIAQDIEVLLPHIVNQFDKYKSIKYEKLTPYLVKANQELYKLIQEQKNQINDLQNQLNIIKQYLNI